MARVELYLDYSRVSVILLLSDHLQLVRLPLIDWTEQLNSFTASRISAFKTSRMLAMKALIVPFLLSAATQDGCTVWLSSSL